MSMARPFSPANEPHEPEKARGRGCLIPLLVVGGLLGIGIAFGPPAPTAEERVRRQALEAAEMATKDANCAQDLKCTGEKFAARAESVCRPAVERLARFDFQWTTGFLEPRFSHFRWKGDEKKIVTYIGGKIKFQNGFGAWQHYRYECDYDLTSGIALEARANPGQL